MAVFELEQRYVPLIECQAVWQPWGPAGRYVTDNDTDGSDGEVIPARRPTRRARSWGGYASYALRSRLEQAGDPTAGVGADGSGMIDDGITTAPRENQTWICASDVEDVARETEEQVCQAWNMLAMSAPEAQEDSCRCTGADNGAAMGCPSYTSVGQYSESQVDQAAWEYQFASECTESTYLSESSCGSPGAYLSEGQWSDGFLMPPDDENLGGNSSSEAAVEQPQYSSYSSDLTSASRGQRRKRRTNKKPKVSPESMPEAITTLMVQNLPFSLSREDFLAELDRSGYSQLYNFCHLPRTFKTGKNQGFAFVNFVSQAVAEQFTAEWHGSRIVLGPSNLLHKALRVKHATIQGIDACEQMAQSKRMKRVKTGTFKPLVIGQAREATAA